MTVAPPGPSGPKRELGLRAIILYKLVKAALAVAVAAMLWLLISTGEAEHVVGLAARVRRHFTAAWSLTLVDAVVNAANARHIEELAAALSLDGALTLFEWYALRTGRPWGAWLVVLATASLLPFEVAAILRHGSVARIVVFLVNVAIVGYLGRRSLRRHGVPWGGKPAADRGVKG